MKRFLTYIIEFLRPSGIIAIYIIAEIFGKDPVLKFHILGPAIVIIMSGSVAIESLFLGEAASEKIGYKPDRKYQIQ